MVPPECVALPSSPLTYPRTPVGELWYSQEAEPWYSQEAELWYSQEAELWYSQQAALNGRTGPISKAPLSRLRGS